MKISHQKKILNIKTLIILIIYQDIFLILEKVINLTQPKIMGERMKEIYHILLEIIY